MSLEGKRAVQKCRLFGLTYLLTFIGLFLTDSVVYLVSNMDKVTIELCDFSDGEKEKEKQAHEKIWI